VAAASQNKSLYAIIVGMNVVKRMNIAVAIRCGINYAVIRMKSVVGDLMD
jgi:hypothetical protein